MKSKSTLINFGGQNPTLLPTVEPVNEMTKRAIDKQEKIKISNLIVKSTIKALRKIK